MSVLITHPYFSKIALSHQEKMLKHLFRHFVPMCLAVLILLILEAFILRGPIQQKLDWMVVNPLPVKIAQLEHQSSSPVDVLSLGTSRTLNGFNAKAFKKVTPAYKSVYNMGIPQAGYDFMLAYLKHYVRKQGKPKLLLLEATDFLLNLHYVSSDIFYHDLILRDPDRLLDILINPLYNLQDKGNILLSVISGIHRYRKVLAPSVVNLTLSNILTSKPPDKRQTDFDLDDHGWQPLLESDVGMTANKLWVQGVETQELKAILHYCREISLPVVLVQWPDHESYQNLAAHAPLVRVYEQAVRETAHQYGAPVINLNGIPASHNPKLYTDIRHLNPSGATQYSAILAEQLKKFLQTD